MEQTNYGILGDAWRFTNRRFGTNDLSEPGLDLRVKYNLFRTSFGKHLYKHESIIILFVRKYW
jgi:hypothetical protein